MLLFFFGSYDWRLNERLLFFVFGANESHTSIHCYFGFSCSVPMSGTFKIIDTFFISVTVSGTVKSIANFVSHFQFL